MALKIFKNKGENGAIPLSAENLNYNFNEISNEKINIADIVNNLTTDDNQKVLSASMGKQLRNLICIDRLVNVDISTIKYHCLCGVDSSCSNWIGGYGVLICIPLSQNSPYAIQIGITNATVKWRSSIANGTYEEWKPFS